MRVLHVAATFGQGGIATSLWHLLPALNKLPEMDVDGAAFYEIGWFGELLEADGIAIHHLQMAHKYDPRVLFKLIKLFRQYDVIHAHGWPIVLFVALASLFSGERQYVLTEHSVTNGRRRPFLKWLDRFVYSRFDSVVAVSQAVADSLQDWLPQIAKKITVIYNGINMDYFQSAEPESEIRRRLGLAEQTPVVFASGNFRFCKGFDLLLQSMVILLEQFRQAKAPHEDLPMLVITGEGALQDSMAGLVNQLGIADNVKFLGFRTDMPVILRTADLFVLSSRWEGCPMVILESMALGVPILATNVGGVPELVLHDQTGQLIAPGSAEALANGLFTLLQDPERMTCFAEQGRQRLVQSFSVENSACAMSTVYRQPEGNII
ncbi:MAG: glycosyltransferase [Candidatus Promineifilaceae bacterium]